GNPRGWDNAVVAGLAACQWVREHHNVLITGPTGIGKTWLGCALGHQACRDGLTALYLRRPRFFQELPIAKGDGRYGKLLTTLAKTDVLILDDWGLAPFSDENRRDLRDCSKDTGFIQSVHDGVRRGFVDSLRRGLHAPYPAPGAHGSALACVRDRRCFASYGSAGSRVPRHGMWRAAAYHRETSGLFPVWEKRASSACHPGVGSAQDAAAVAAVCCE